MGVLLVTAAIVIATGVGIAAERRWPARSAAAARKAMVVILYVLLPPVIFFNIAAADIDLNHGLGLVLGWVALSITAVLVWWTASRVLRLPPAQTGAVICSVLVVNSGYLGYPMAVALLGRDQLSDAVLWDVLVSGPALLLGAFAVGAAFGTKAGESPRQRVAAFFTRNPLSTRRSPLCWLRKRSRRRCSWTPRRRSSWRPCRSASSRSARRSRREPSTASCRCRRR